MSRYFIFIPNFLSIVRIGLVYPILNNINNADYLEGLIFFAIASITDALDGFLARRMSWQTDLGKILDPVADKLLLSGSIFILWINDLLPFYVFFILLARDIIILLGASIHMTIIETGTPLPNFAGKITTVLQVIYIILILIFKSLSLNFSLEWLGFIVSVFTLISLYIYSQSWFRTLKKNHND
jgi:cardiolipin synthase